MKIWLLLASVVACLAFVPALAAEDASAPVEIITLGDSITKGVRPGVKSEETFASLVAAALQEKHVAAKVTNVGIGGERTDQALKRLEKAVIAAKPQVVTIMYGTNDSYVDIGKQESRLSLDTYRGNLVQLVERLRRAGIQPILMTEPKWGAKGKLNGVGEHPNVRLAKYVAACREVAAEHGVPLVDHFEHWSESEAKGQNLSEWTTDECHPNPRGHRELAEQIVPVIQKWLASRKP